MTSALQFHSYEPPVEHAGDVDYIQDPSTGRFQGSHGHGGKEPAGGGKGGGKGKHPGEGYSKHAVERADGSIYTTNVNDAARALHEGKKVELDQPKKVSTLIRKLGEEAQRMQKAGQKAPVFNLCDVSVSGTNLFCAESKGIPRVKMPQLDEEQTKAFVKILREKYKVEKDNERADHLRATQDELNGAKVAKNMDRIDAAGDKKAPRLIVSRDDYILDGHHRWAAKVGIDAKDGVLGNDTKLRIWRVDIPITKLLEEANKFTGGKGGKSVAESYRPDLLYRRYDPPPF